MIAWVALVLAAFCCAVIATVAGALLVLARKVKPKLAPFLSMLGLPK